MTYKSAFVAVLVAVLSGGCRVMAAERPPLGDMTSRIVVAADALWSESQASVLAELAPRIVAAHEEPAFDVTHVAPGSPDLARLRQFRQLIVVGTPSDAWIADLVGDAGGRSPPYLAERRNVWAQDQSVDIVVLPDTGRSAALAALLPSLGARLDERFQAWVRQRMFRSGVQNATRDSVAGTMAFALALPALYESERHGERVVGFHNRTTVGGELYRTIVVAWRPGVRAPVGADDVLAWRDSVAAQVYGPGQATERARTVARRVPASTDGSLEVRSAWRTVSGPPRGGPLIDRVIICPDQDRTYFLEAWLYGPGRRKHEYLLQFEILLDSFGCGARPV